MRPIGIVHHVERLAQLNQAIDEQLGALEVHVVITRAMDDKELCIQSVSEADRRSIVISLDVLRGQPM